MGTKKIKAIELFIFSLTLGIESLKQGIITKESIKRITCPMDPSRFYEIPRVANAIQKSGKLLDISSPKLLAFYLAKNFPKIELTSIDKFQREIKEWSQLSNKPKNLTLFVTDATKLPYSNNSFDEVYSISVLEHVAGNGDSRVVKEIYRILKPKGKFFFTTMISNKFKVVYREKDIYSNTNKSRKSFFCRIYDYQSLEKRILTVAPFHIITEEVCNYRFPVYEKIFNKLTPYSALFGWVNLLFAPLMINITDTQATILNRADYFGVLEKDVK